MNAQCLRLEFQRSVGWSGLLAVNGKGKSPAAGAAFYIDRGVIGIGHLDILVCSRNSRVVGRRHIGHDHRMVLSLGYLQLRKQRSIVQGGGDLAYASPHAVHNLAVFIGGCRGVSVGCGKGLHTFITGQRFPRHQDAAVDLGRAYLKIGGSGPAAAAEIRGKCPQHILNLGQHLRGLCRLRNCHRRRYMDRLL